MDQREQLRKHAARAALNYWRSLMRAVRAGKDLASEHEGRFLAGSKKSRTRLARDFYSKAHLAKLVALTRAQVVDRLTPWLESAIDAALEWESDEPAKQRRFLTRLVRSQHVVRVEHHDGGSPIVDGHPNEEALYGDLYELSASGASVGGIIYLYKATGEPFAPVDRRITVNGMRREFYVNAASDGDAESWDFTWLADYDDNRMIVVSVDPRSGVGESV